MQHAAGRQVTTFARSCGSAAVGKGAAAQLLYSTTSSSTSGSGSQPTSPASHVSVPARETLATLTQPGSAPP